MTRKQPGETITRREWMCAGVAAAYVLPAVASAREQPTFSFDPNRVPVSRYGSYLAVSNHFWSFGVSPQVPSNHFYVRCLQDDPSPPEVFRIELLQNGAPIPIETEGTPGRLVLKTGQGGRVEFCIAAANLIRIRGTGCILRLHTVIGSYANSVQTGEGIWQIMPDAARSPVQVKRLGGSMTVDAPWLEDTSHVQCSKAVFTFDGERLDPFECSLQFFEGAPVSERVHQPFDNAMKEVEAEFEEWAARVPTLDPKYEPRRKLAAYVLWSSTVAPRGLYQTPVVWGSKNWMARIWSWDHCFAALGLANAHPEFAWQQYMIFQQMQDPASGMLADSMSNIKRSWLCTKDPVHGWALRHLLRLMPNTVNGRRLQEAYEPLSLWTEYWMKYRNLDNDGLPCIFHPNESFDNITANTMDGAVKAPEIATYLAIQMEVLSDAAQTLGKSAEARRWRESSDALVDALLRILWLPHEQRFVTKRVRDNRIGPGDTVLAFIPLMLGNRLPAEIQRALVKGLTTPDRFLTPFGFSTEALTSPLYDPNSYVKGPVWAPMNVFLSEGLDAAGETKLANEIRQRFSGACLKGGMSEHFDARTGTPGGDPAYIWTAGMYLYLNRKQY